MAERVKGGIDLKSRPNADSQTLRVLHEDSVVTWLREVVGPPPANRVRRNWVETPDGFIYAPMVQPVRNSPNEPLEHIEGSGPPAGLWVEVTVPYVNLALANPPPRSPWLNASLERGIPPRLYYSQIILADQVRTDDEGRILYRLVEPYGSHADTFWAPGEAFRPLTEQEMAPIAPEADDKRILVDNTKQTLSCFEDGQEVYYCTVSTGVNFDVQGEPMDESSTPLGNYPIWRKLVSVHMSGGTTGGGRDISGVGWTSLFAGSGVAIHSTFWHNNFGAPMSRGCVNARPEDARWVFRWTTSVVPYSPGDVTVSMPGGTRVEVVAS